MRKLSDLKRLIGAVAVCGLAMGYAATPAQASFVLRIDDLATVGYEFTAVDGLGPFYSAIGTPGPIAIGVFSVVSAVGSNPPIPGVDVIDMVSGIVATGAGHMTMELTGTDFFQAMGPAGSNWLMNWGGTANGAIKVTASGCKDPLNREFECVIEEGYLVAPPPTPFALTASGSVGPLLSPYSMYLKLDIVTEGPADASSNLRLSNTSVPEPGSMVLLGTGLVGLARATRRRYLKTRA